MSISFFSNRHLRLNTCTSFIWTFLIPFWVALGCIRPATAEFYTPVPKASPTVPADHPLGRGCALSFVQGVLRICCEKSGRYDSQVNNCTGFAHNFHKLCAEYLGPENCFSVGIHCDAQDVHHRINMIKLGNTYYLVEPQGEIYDRYPFPSPKIPDHVLESLYPGGPCEQYVDDIIKPPNTQTNCAYNDSLLVGPRWPRTIDSGSLQRCYDCCEKERLSPDVTNAKETCRIWCEGRFDPDGEDPNTFFNAYCGNRYWGRACRLCCEYLGKGPECRNACTDPILGPEFDTSPAEDPDVCKSIEQLSANSPNVENCSSCCRRYGHKCDALSSIPCIMWGMKCNDECEKLSRPIAQATKTAAPRL